MDLPLWTILIATFGLIWFLQRRHSKKGKLRKLGLKEIPGPRGLPIVGNILQLEPDGNKTFSKWTEEYGDIYQIKMGSMTTVVVSDPKLTKEIFSDPNYTGRYFPAEFSFWEDLPDVGILASEGERWEVHRRFLLRQLRDFGFGKSSMQALIMDEVQELIAAFKKQAGTPVAGIKERVRLAVVSSLWRIITSKRFKHDDPAVLQLANSTSDVINDVVAKGSILLFLPWLKHFIPGLSGYTEMRKVFDEMLEFLDNGVKEKEKAFLEGDLNDFIDVYLAEMKKDERNPQSHFHGELARRQLIAILADMFFAGSDTTATTLGWGVLYLCRHPKEQEKLHQEISEVTGDSRDVSIDDRPNMPYTLAVIDEILRMSSIAPDGIQHRALDDRSFHGYLIEKDTLVQPNLRYIHHNPKIWGDPENFRPERFLSPDGKKYVKNENLQAFQPGRRACVGETLARDSLFLYLTSLFQHFSMKFNPNEPEPTLERVPGLVISSLPYSVIMTNRR